MRRPPLVVGLLAALFLSAGAVQAQDKPAIELPKDPTTPVITFDYFGGGIKRQNDEPLLIIRADGTVNVGNPYGVGKSVTTKIRIAEVRELLRYAIQEQHLLDFDQDKVKAAVADEMKKAGTGIAVGGGSTTIIRIKTAAKEHEARYYAPAAFAQQYKNIKALGELVAVEQRLQRVVHEAVAGGPDEITKALALVNERLKKDYPDARPLTAADLQAARWQGQDTLIVSFFRRGAQPDLFVAGTVTRPAKGDPTVFVKAKVK
jgi:hypothetical protein